MLDHKCKPWLIEVNHTPSFTTDTPLDRNIKKAVIRDALKIMNVSVNNRIRFKNKRREELQKRVLTGKKVKATIEEKQASIEKAQKERTVWESKHLGGFEKIYPFDVNYSKFVLFIFPFRILKMLQNHMKNLFKKLINGGSNGQEQVYFKAIDESLYVRIKKL